ncbi:MAG TPA: M42 family metallopeptidase [Candidatus Ignatzschineria merdigallinarum]|uniref:M42 family metallopeptidase n=1 Tax=Candidatus Ignatzschineria merdigallinarum TaxID=2838621 RepID=A0A9D1Q6E7_9GAMM|nr:M42 family metallopeptidase [Candidatus Ignatzschineria merdigallinarum]
MSFNSHNLLQRLESLVNIPSPSGFTAQALNYIAAELTALNLPVQRTHKGAIITKIAGNDDSRSRLLTAHIDTLGAMVKSISADGRLKLTKIGGFNWNAVEGEYCQIHTRTGKTFTGTILMHETSVHVYRDAGDLPRDDAHMEIRLDEKSQSKAETESLGIHVGDFVSFNPRFEYTDSGFIKSRHLDDKASVALLFSLIEVIQASSQTLPHSLYFYFSNNEEIGYGGNASIPADVVEYLAVDMGAIGDGQTTDEYSVSICAKDSSGPYHYEFTNHLIQLAQKNEIPHQIDIYPFYGSDASAAIRAGFDIRHALIGPGIESSHALERTHLDSMKASLDLLVAYSYSHMMK